MSETIRFSNLREGAVLVVRSKRGTTFEFRIRKVCDDGNGTDTQSMLHIDILGISTERHRFDLRYPATLKLNDTDGDYGTNPARVAAFCFGSLNSFEEGCAALLSQDEVSAVLGIDAVTLRS